jgi:hypothetical protein
MKCTFSKTIRHGENDARKIYVLAVAKKTIANEL